MDYNSYTRDSDSSLDVISGSGLPMERRANGAAQLTTPIAYMTTLLSDPFSQGTAVAAAGSAAVGYRIGSGSWSYDPAFVPTGDIQGSVTVFQQFGPQPAYVMIGIGPDRRRERMGYKCLPYRSPDAAEQGFYMDYDPTNGTTSDGDVYRFGSAFMNGTWERGWSGAGPRGPESL